MLAGIRLENFKALADSQVIPLKPITLLLGPNSSGKSSVMQALLAGRQTARASADAALVLSDGDDFELGNFPEVARQGVSPPWLALTFVSQFNAGAMLTSAEGRLLYNAARRYLKDAHYVRCAHRSEFKYLRKVREIYVQRNEIALEVRTKTDSNAFSVAGKAAVAGRNNKFRWEVRRAGGLFDSEVLGIATRRDRRFFSFPTDFELLPSRRRDVVPHPQAALLGLIRHAARGLQRDLLAIRHVGAMREEPARLYPFRGARPIDVGRRGQRAPDIIFSATRRKQSRLRLMRGLDAALKEMGISSAILARAPTGANAFAIVLDHLKPKVRVNLAGVGFGVSQILPVLVEAYYAPAGSLILLEQPEIHLHPHAQSRIADLLADVATGAGRKRFVVETHSEHLVRRLQVLVADPRHPLTRDDIQVCYFQPQEEETKVSTLEMDESGRFVSEWPEGFFDEGVKQSIAHLDALAAQDASSKK